MYEIRHGWRRGWVDFRSIFGQYLIFNVLILLWPIWIHLILQVSTYQAGDSPFEIAAFWGSMNGSTSPEWLPGQCHNPWHFELTRRSAQQALPVEKFARSTGDPKSTRDRDTVDGFEILHQLMDALSIFIMLTWFIHVYPMVYRVSTCFNPPFGGAGFRNHSPYQPFNVRPRSCVLVLNGSIYLGISTMYGCKTNLANYRVPRRFETKDGEMAAQILPKGK